MKFLKKIAHNIRVHAHTTWLCARDAELGWPLRLLAFAIAGYALSPVDLIPDFIPVIGLLDDAVLIPLGIWLFRKWVPTDIYARNLALAEAASNRPVSKTAAAVIVALWIGVALWLGWAIGLI
jgi:uncharacterized membrane protein YkvA (DUF1232 family)